MLDQCNIENILFLDIETVPGKPGYEDMDPVFRRLWDKKAENLLRQERIQPEVQPTPADIYDRAGIYAEFGKIICISTGIFRNGTLWIRSFSGDEEKNLLTDFADLLNKAREKRFQLLCAHNGKEFDFPYIIRRMLINRIQVPSILDLSGKKPWEVNHLDTMELWKFGDFKNYTSLELLTAVFGIPTPKDDINGKDVARVYYQERDLARIVKYCQKDVIAIVNLFLRFQGKDLVEESHTSYL